ncbi:hypothetical protein PZB74_12320 [Porifericola rhodea]|nr:hypothetical protein [Porifericola rhodea]WKN29751.1 hypothetical protein PZB74_12320 [Porifericola rhodea]
MIKMRLSFARSQARTPDKLQRKENLIKEEKTVVEGGTTLT